MSRIEVAESLKLMAYEFMLSYKTTWEEFMTDEEKFNYTFEEVMEEMR